MNKRKKILYMVTKANWGGAQKYVFDLATEMLGRDYDVVVAYGEPFGELVEKLEAFNLKLEEESASRIKLIPIENLGRDVNLMNEFRATKALWTILKEEKPDVIHLNSPKIGGLGALLGRLARVPRIIYTAHGWSFNERRPAWQSLLIKYFSWVTILLSHKTIVIAKTEMKQVAGWPLISEGKLVQIYNGIKGGVFLNRVMARNFFGSKGIEINEEDTLIITIAELHSNKGLDYGIEAFKELSEAHLNLKYLIIGEGEERNYLEALVRDYGLEGRVFFCGHLADAAYYLKAGDIFLLPSLKEGFPFVLLEAGLTGLAVVSSDVGGISELITGGENGILVEAGVSSEMALAMETLLENKGLRKNYAEGLERKVATEFSFERMVIKVEELYK